MARTIYTESSSTEKEKKVSDRAIVLLGDKKLRYKVVGVTHAGNVRDSNQDNYYIDGSFRSLEHESVEIEKKISEDDRWIAAVFDGMGGEKAGEIASLIAAEATERICNENDAACNIGAMIAAANEDICTEMTSRNCSMGSTCVYLEFDDEWFRSWNIGDSRAYCFHEGELIQLTKDHTEAEYYASILMDADIMIGSTDKLSQYLGIYADDFTIEPYISEWVKACDNDLIMICSDGLTQHMSDDEICDVFKSKEDLKEKKKSLLDISLERGGVDNITFMLIEACA